MNHTLPTPPYHWLRPRKQAGQRLPVSFKSSYLDFIMCLAPVICCLIYGLDSINTLLPLKRAAITQIDFQAQ